MPPRGKALADWVDENPLREWRYAHRKRTLNLIEATLNVRRQTIYNWEHGSHHPSDENLKALASLMGVRFRDLRRQWRQWEQRRPATRPPSQRELERHAREEQEENDPFGEAALV